MSDESSAATSLLDAGDAPGAPRAVLGRLAGIDEDGRIRFSDGARTYPVRIGVVCDDATLARAAASGQTAVVVGTTEGPVLLALVRERVSHEALTHAASVPTDPETLTLTADRRVELTCGKARIVLERDGRIHLQGTHLLSSATGPVRIKGATVALN